MRIGIASVILCGSIAFYAAQVASAQSNGCPTGQQPATASDIATMTAAGISNAVVGMCWSPSSAATGAAAAQAKQYLQSAKCGGSTIDTNNINSGFALCAQKFVQSAKAQDQNFCITSAYRSSAQQLAACMNICGASSCPGLCAAPGNSFHQYGLAIDVNSKKIPLQTIWNLAQAQGILNPTSLHSSDPYHIQAQSKTGGLCNSGGSAQPQTPLQSITSAITSALGLNTQTQIQPCPTGYAMTNGVCQLQTSIYSTPGVGSTPQAGQILSQDSYCLVSTNPIITYPVPAGTPYPSGCLNGAQTTCSTGYVLSNGVCTPQQSCPAGYTLVNGFCSQMQQQQAAQPAAAQATTPASTASTPTSTAAPATSGTTATQGVSTSGITAPTLVPNLGGTTTAALLEELANPQAPAQAATNTPITLSGAATDISELEATAMPGVTSAVPTGSLFVSGASTANPQSGASASVGTNDGGNTITTTSGTGYDIQGDTGTAPGVAPGTENDIASTQAPSADTFGSGSASNNQPTAFVGGPSTFTTSVLSTLAVLKGEVIGAIDFLAIYARPFGGNAPSQVTSE
jgi:hypothetical protein